MTVELHPVTTDRYLMWDLVRRWENGDDVVAHAFNLGLFPPGYEEGVRYDVELVYPTAEATDDEAVFVWSTSDFGDGRPEVAPAPNHEEQGSAEPPPF